MQAFQQLIDEHPGDTPNHNMLCSLRAQVFPILTPGNPQLGINPSPGGRAQGPAGCAWVLEKSAAIPT